MYWQVTDAIYQQSRNFMVLSNTITSSPGTPVKFKKPLAPDQYDFITIEIWIKLISSTLPSSGSPMVVIQDHSNPSNFRVMAVSANVLELKFSSLSNQFTHSISSSISTNAWSHISARLDIYSQTISSALQFDYQSSTFIPTVPPFTFTGDLSLGISPTFEFLAAELRIWSYYREWKELNDYAYNDMTDFQAPLLVSYWRMKGQYDYTSLEDTGVNPQSKLQSGTLKYVSDETYPAVCRFDQVWAGYCIAKTNTYQNLYKVTNTTCQRVLYLDSAIIGPFYILEFWFKPGLTALSDGILFQNSDIKVQFEGSNNYFKVRRVSDNAELSHPNYNLTTGWQHLMMKFTPNPSPTLYDADACLMLTCLDAKETFTINPTDIGDILFDYVGYVKEMRVWEHDSLNFLHFWRQKIPIYKRPGLGLLDYLRFIRYTSTDDSEVFNHLVPASANYPLQIDMANIPNGNIADNIVNYAISSNLQECLFGQMYDGVKCLSDRVSLRARSQMSSIDLAPFNQTSTEPAVFQWGFFFRMTVTMLDILSSAGSGDLTLIYSSPTYAAGLYLFQFYVREGDNNLIISCGGVDQSYGALNNETSSKAFRLNHWYYAFKAKSLNDHTAWLVGQQRILLREDRQYSVMTYLHPVSLDQTIYLGQNTPGQNRFDPEFAIRDFFVDQTSGFQMSLDQVLYHPRNPLLQMKWAGLYLPFNDTQGLFLTDPMRPEYQRNIRDYTNTDYVWEWDPTIPIQCNGPHIAMYTSKGRHICDYKSVYHFKYAGPGNTENIMVFDDLEVVPAPMPNTLTELTKFSLTFYLRISGDPYYSALQQVFTLNPTDPSSTNQIIFRGYHMMVPGVYYHFKFSPSIHGVLGDHLNCSNYLQSWGQFALIKDGDTFYYRCANGRQESVVKVGPYSIPFDSTIKFGGTTPGYETFDGQLKDFKFYNDAIDYKQQLSDLIQQKPFGKFLVFYYALDEPKGSLLQMKYNLARVENQIYQEFDNTTLPSTDLFYPLDTMQWNHYGSATPMFLPSTVVEELNFNLLPPKVGGYTEWVLELRLLKQYNLNEGLFDLSGFITITAQNSGGVNIKLGTDLIGYDTSAFMQLDVWIHLALMSCPGLATTTLYINSQPLADIPHRVTLPNVMMNWKFPNNNVAIKEMRIWSDCMPLTFLKQATLKDMDGLYYPNLFFYLPMRIQYDRASAARRYTMATYDDIWIGVNRGVGMQDYNYCYDVEEVFDGFSCNSQKYVHLTTDDFTNLEFPLYIPGSSPASLPEWTLEFWILFMKGTDVGNIVKLKMDDGTAIAYLEGGRKVYYQFYSAPATLSYQEQAYDTLTDFEFAKSYWKKMIISYSSLPTLTCSVQVTESTPSSKSHALCLSSSSSAPKFATFCDGSGPCNFALRHVIMWSKTMSYSPRSPPIYAELANLIAYWALDDKEELIFRDSSPRSLVYPILVQHPYQNFRWKHPHQISPYADHLFMCLDPSSIYNEITELCEPLNVLTPAFFPSANPVTLQHNQLGPLSKDWSIDFWLKYTSANAFTKINFITQNGAACSSALSGGIILNIAVVSLGSGTQSMLAEDLIDVTRIPNVNTDIIIKPLRYFHYSLINSGAQDKLSSILNFTNWQDSSPSFDYLSPCDFQIGLQSVDDPSISFSIKQLKVWSAAMKIGEIMHWSLATMVNQGYPNLVLYYRMDNDLFKDTVSGLQSVQAYNNFVITGDNDMTLNCPLGLNFDWINRRCYYVDYAVRYDIQSYFTWDHSDALQNTFQDIEPSFTLYVHTYVPAPNVTTSVVSFGDLLNLRWHNLTYILEVQLTSTLRANYSLSYNGQAYNHWFFTFNFGTKELRVVRDSDVLDTAYLSLDMMNYIASQVNFQTKIGYLGTLGASYNEYSAIGFKQIEIFRPPLTFQQTQMIAMKGIRSHLEGFMGLQGGVRSDYNYMLWTTSMLSTTYELTDREYLNSNVGYIAFPGIEGCFTGTNKVRITCFEPSSLIVHGKTLTLDVSNTEISTSFTLQGWFFVKYMDVTSTTDIITFLKIPNLVTISLIDNDLQLIIENTIATSILFPSVLGKWLHISVALQDFTWRVIVNRQLLMQYLDPQQHVYDSLAISQLKISSPNKLTVMKIKELVMFGHARDIEEITSDFGAQISRLHHYNQMLFYYPLMETGQGVVYDLSTQGRYTNFGENTNGLYWDFEGRGPVSTDMTQLSTTEEYTGFITRQKALYFQMGKTGETTFGQLPASPASPSFSLSLFITFRDSSLFPIEPMDKAILVIKQPGGPSSLVRLTASQTRIKCSIGDSSTHLEVGQILNKKWALLICGYDEATSSAFIQRQQGIPLASQEIKDTFAITSLNPAGYEFVISDFEGHMKDFRLFSECLDPATLIKYSRQRLNMLNTEYPLTFGMRMDESLGLQLLETASANSLSMLSSNGIFPQWQEPWETYKVCEGHSRYIIERDYCQYEEKFMRPITPFTMSFTIYEQQMGNLTLAMWVLFEEFGTDPSAALSITLQDRFDWAITPLGVTKVTLGNPPQLLILRDDSSSLGRNGWVLLYLRIVSPFNFVYNYVGVPEANSNPLIGFKGTSLQEADFYFPPITPAGLTFTIRFGTNSVIIPRNLQLWNNPFSLEVLKRRVLRSPNPMRFVDNLVALFRFDESGGRTLYNTAGYRHRLDQKMITNANIRWSHYTYLDVNNATDLESMRGFLFCLEPNSRRAHQHCEYYKCSPSCISEDCTGPSNDDCVNSTSLINPLSPRDQISMIFDPVTMESFECNPKCKECKQAFVNQNCLSCVDTLVLNNGVCGQTCPPFEHFIGGACYQCSNPLCVCEADNLNGCIACRDPIADLYLIPKQTCVSSCETREFFDAAFQDCKDCHNNCGSCFGATYLQCITCRDASNYYLASHSTCLPRQCPTGSRFDATGLQCLDCEHPCAECEGTSTNCSKCVKDYAFEGLNNCVLCVDIEGFDFPWIEDANEPGGGRCTEICGDGLNFGLYQCDDGNQISGDGCSASCSTEANYECTGGSPSTSDTCSNKKGPTFEISKISADNSLITLTFDKRVTTKQKVFDKDTLIIKINGVDLILKEEENFNLLAKVTDGFFDSSRLVIHFNPSFAINNGDLIEIGFKNANVIRDINGNPLNMTLSDKQRLNGHDPAGEPSKLMLIKKIGEGISSGSKFTMQTNFLVSVILGKALEKLWLAINSCQIIYFIPLMSIPFPKILVTALKYLEFTNVDIELDTQPFFFEYIKISEIKDKAVAESFLNYGYPSSIFFLSYSDKMQVWIFVLALYPVLLIFSKLLKHPLFNFLRKLEKGYRFNMILRFLIELYLEMTLFAFMNIYSLQYSTMTRAIASFIALAFMAFLTYFPALCLTLIQRYQLELQKENIKEVIGELYEDTRFQENKLMNQFYIGVFLFRRLVYVIVLVLLKDYPQLQVAVCIVKTAAILWFTIKLMPFKSKMVNYQNIMNEALIGVAFSTCYVFQKVMDEEERDLYGYVIIAIVVIIITFNVIIVLIETLANCLDWVKQVRAAGGLKDYYHAKLTQAFKVQPQVIKNDSLSTTQPLKHESITSEQKNESDQIDMSLLNGGPQLISTLKQDLHMKSLSQHSVPEQSRCDLLSQRDRSQYKDQTIDEDFDLHPDIPNTSMDFVQEQEPRFAQEQKAFKGSKQCADDVNPTFRKVFEEVVEEPSLIFIQDIRMKQYIESMKTLDQANIQDQMLSETQVQGPNLVDGALKVRKRVNQNLRVIDDNDSDGGTKNDCKQVDKNARGIHKLKLLKKQ